METYTSGNSNIDKEIERLRAEYSSKIKESYDFWIGQSVIDFVKEYKEEVKQMLSEYPKFYFDEVMILAGIHEKDLPFKKELLQAKLLQIITSNTVVLLPRYVKRLFNRIFNIHLNNGSIADAFIIYPNDLKLVEFKYCKVANLVSRINEAALNCDFAFIVSSNVDFKYFNKNRTSKIISKNECEIYLLDNTDSQLYKIKREQESSPFTLKPISVGYINDNLMTIYLKYISDLKKVNQIEIIDYEEYFAQQFNNYISPHIKL